MLALLANFTLGRILNFKTLPCPHLPIPGTQKRGEVNLHKAHPLRFSGKWTDSVFCRIFSPGGSHAENRRVGLPQMEAKLSPNKVFESQLSWSVCVCVFSWRKDESNSVFSWHNSTPTESPFPAGEFP